MTFLYGVVMGKTPAVANQPSQTLAKGLMILEAFDPQQPTLGIRELARKLDMNPATVVRLVTTLESAGYLTQDAKTQRYGLGPVLMKLASLYMHHNPLPQFARRVFETYADRFEYNFYLGTLSGHQVIYLAVLDGRGRIKVVVEAGGSTGLHSTALGKVLLAFQSDEFIHDFIRRSGLPAYTENSITKPDLLWKQIRDIRLTGIAVNNGEHFEDIAAIATPVFGADGKVIAGVSLAYPRHLYPDAKAYQERISALLREIAEEINTYTATHS
ncbi:IclR family transcriptional regulator [Oscillatoria laete-virens NRMC-F 0139]|nr:IclR family transcriptional regulator [Oscillatoria laete-virens]MDL5054603.1 IclR family transcriptional regulator [Oscillatoria laete-virens NRMC-F 0139]